MRERELSGERDPHKKAQVLDNRFSFGILSHVTPSSSQVPVHLYPLHPLTFSSPSYIPVVYLGLIPCTMKLLSFIMVSVLILLAINSTALNEGRDAELMKMMDEEVSFSNMMGLDMEGCEAGDHEECMKRRMIYEAHLDYIYTQHHKP